MKKAIDFSVYKSGDMYVFILGTVSIPFKNWSANECGEFPYLSLGNNVRISANEYDADELIAAMPAEARIV